MSRGEEFAPDSLHLHRVNKCRDFPFGSEFEPSALTKIIEATQGYPYFLQEWGKHCWAAAHGSPITAEDVATASATAAFSPLHRLAAS